MNTKRYLQFMLAAKAAKAKVPVMDGGPTVLSEFVDWDAHDARYHGGHWQEGQRCKLREMRDREDLVDMVAPGNGDTTISHGAEVLASALESGLLDETDHQTLVEEFQQIRNAIEGLDDMSDGDMKQLAQRMRDFNAVYSSLASMNAEEAVGPEPEQEQEPEPETTPAPTSPAPTTPPPSPSTEQSEQSAPGGLVRDTTAAGSFRYPELERGNRWRGYEEVSRIERLRNANYDWPVHSRNGRITVEQITPELVEAVAAHQKLNARNNWTIAQRTDRVMNVLGNPAACEDSYRYQQAFQFLEQGGRPGANPEKRHLRQIFDALHPGYMENREERRRAAREAAEQELLRQQVQNLENAAQTARNDGTLRQEAARRVNFTEDDATDAVNRIVSRVGEQYRDRVRGAIDTFQRTGNIPSNGIAYLNQALPSDHPVRVAIVDAANRQAMERDRLRNSATLDEATTNKLSDLAQRTGVRFVPGGVATEGGHSDGYNCYLAALVYGMRRSGLDMPFKGRPVGYDHSSQEYFLPMKQAMADAGWERINGRTREETIANLDRLAQTKPNDYTIEMWSAGHHGTNAFLHNGQWYKYDVYGGTYSGPHTSEEIVHSIASLPEGNVREMDDRQRRLMSMAIRRGIPIEQRQELQRTGQMESYIEDKLKESGRVAEASFGHMPGDYTEEIIRQALRD